VRAHVTQPAVEDGLGALGSSAAAHGSSIAFRDPVPDRSVDAHELAHVVQQRRAGEHAVAAFGGIGGLYDAAEHEADRAADDVVAGQPARVEVVAGSIRRTPEIARNVAISQTIIGAHTENDAALAQIINGSITRRCSPTVCTS
jgi:hypothetical protein